MVDTVATLEPDSEQVGNLSKLSLAQLDAMFLDTEYIAPLLNRNRLFTIFYEALEHNSE